MEATVNKRHPIVIAAWILLSLVVICGCLLGIFLLIITPPPDGPTNVPNGSPVAAIGKAYPGKYAVSAEVCVDARALTADQRKDFTGNIYLDNDEWIDHAPIEFSGGKQVEPSGTTLDQFIRKQPPARVIKYHQGSSLYEVELPKDSVKMEQFSGSLSMGIENNDSFLYFKVKKGAVVSSSKTLMANWD